MNEDEIEEMNDTIGVVSAEMGDLYITSEILFSETIEKESTGIKVTSPTGEVYLCGGIQDGDTRATVGQRLSPDSARELADTLYDAADDAERHRDEAAEYDPRSDDESILQKLMSMVHGDGKDD